MGNELWRGKKKRGKKEVRCASLAIGNKYILKEIIYIYIYIYKLADFLCTFENVVLSCVITHYSKQIKSWQLAQVLPVQPLLPPSLLASCSCTH